MPFPKTRVARSLLATTLATTFGAAVALAPAGAGTTTTTSPSSSTDTVNVVGYSVVGPAFKALETAFKATPAGQNVSFTNSFGSSDTLTYDVAEGQPADLVNLSYEPNITTLVLAGKVPANWSSQELSIGGVNTALKGKQQETVYATPGILTDSVVAFIVRKGNPLGIKNWGDLVKSGVQLVTPNPLTSGSAKWNLLAGYAAQIVLKRTPNEGQNYLKAFISHTVAQPASGSSAMTAFLDGTGNVLLDYEDDAIAAQTAGDPIQIVTPPETLLIQNPVALTNTGLDNPGAKAFYQFLFSTAGQDILAGLGYRSVLTSVWDKTEGDFAAFKKPTDLMTVGLLGGWPEVDQQFFSSTVVFPKGSSTYPDQGIVTYLEQYAGSAS